VIQRGEKEGREIGRVSGSGGRGSQGWNGGRRRVRSRKRGGGLVGRESTEGGARGGGILDSSPSLGSFVFLSGVAALSLGTRRFTFHFRSFKAPRQALNMEGLFKVILASNGGRIAGHLVSFPIKDFTGVKYRGEYVRERMKIERGRVWSHY